MGIIGALLLGICITLFVVCQLLKTKPSTGTTTESNPNGNTGPQSPPKVLDERPPPTSPDLVPTTVPPPRPPRMEIPTTNPQIPSQATYDPKALNHMNYDNNSSHYQGSVAPGYSDVRNMEEVMSAIWKIQTQNIGAGGQAFPLATMPHAHPVDAGYSG